MRLADMVYYPNKNHHKQYIRHYAYHITDEGMRHAFDADGYEKAKLMLKEILETE